MKTYRPPTWEQQKAILEQERRAFITARIADEAVASEPDIFLREELYGIAYREADQWFNDHPAEYEAIRLNLDRELGQLKIFRPNRIMF